MSKEEEKHINKSDAIFATVSGTLIGTGTIVPPLLGIGVAVGAVGVIRVNSHERDRQLERLSDYLNI